jgi:hypothetical protein
MSKTSAKRIRIEDYHMDPVNHPGWVSAHDRTPTVGDKVLCAGGPGTLAAVLGRTGDGSRLLQIQLATEEPKTPPFFAAASNVLVSAKARKAAKG